MKGFWSQTIANPVLERELKTRHRSWRAPAVLTIYLVVLAALTLGVLALMLGASGGAVGFRAGSSLFLVLAAAQYACVAFLAPALSAAGISGERERQTLDLLLCTQLSAAGIVWGKWLSSLAYLLLLVVAALPLYALVFFLGGVAPGEVALTLWGQLETALVLGALGIFCSALFRRSVTATVASLVLTVFLVGGSLVVPAMYRGYLTTQGGGLGFFPLVAYLNPLTPFLANLPGGGGLEVLKGMASMRLQTPAGVVAATLNATQLTWISYGTQAVLLLLLLLASARLLEPVIGKPKTAVE